MNLLSFPLKLIQWSQMTSQTRCRCTHFVAELTRVNCRLLLKDFCKTSFRKFAVTRSHVTYKFGFEEIEPARDVTFTKPNKTVLYLLESFNKYSFLLEKGKKKKRKIFSMNVNSTSFRFGGRPEQQPVIKSLVTAIFRIMCNVYGEVCLSQKCLLMG